MPTPQLAVKKEEALRSLGSHESVLVALSGGVDSGVLLALAIEALGREKVLAVTGRSPSLPAADLEDARAVAEALTARHQIVDTSEMERDGYRANAGDRCYHCRTELFDVLQRIAEKNGIAAITYGAIFEDSLDYRPGMRAARERGILAPLLEARLDKEDIRALAAEARIPVHDKPASACLSSRIPIGTEVTEERLRQIGQAEESLHSLGFRQVRVRHHGEIARLEMDDEAGVRLQDPVTRARVVELVKASGFRYVTIDLEGYRSGSLNPLKRLKLQS